MIEYQLKGAAALAAMEAAGQLFTTPAGVSAVLERDIKSVRAAIGRGEIPAIKVGPRYQISVAWLRRQADGVPDPQPVQAAS